MLVTVPLSIIMMILLWSFYFIAIFCVVNCFYFFSLLVYLPYHEHIVYTGFLLFVFFR